MFHQIDDFFLNSSTGSEVSQDHPYQRSSVWSDHEVWRWEAGVHAARQKPSPGLAHGVQSQVISFLLQGGAPLLGILPGQFSLFLIEIFLQLEAILCQKGAITFSCIFFRALFYPKLILNLAPSASSVWSVEDSSAPRSSSAIHTRHRTGSATGVSTQPTGGTTFR